MVSLSGMLKVVTWSVKLKATYNGGVVGNIIFISMQAEQIHFALLIIYPNKKTVFFLFQRLKAIHIGGVVGAGGTEPVFAAPVISAIGCI